MATKRRYKKRRSGLGNSPSPKINNTLIKALGELEASISSAKNEECRVAFNKFSNALFLLGKASNATKIETDDMVQKIRRARNKVMACFNDDPSLRDD